MKLDTCNTPLLIAKESEKAVAVTFDGGQTFVWMPKSQIETASLDLANFGECKMYVVKIASWIANEKGIITRQNKHRFPKILGGF